MFNHKLFIFLFFISLLSFSQESSTDNQLNEIEEVVAVGTRASVKSSLDKQKESNQLV